MTSLSRRTTHIRELCDEATGDDVDVAETERTEIDVSKRKDNTGSGSRPILLRQAAAFFYFRISVPPRAPRRWVVPQGCVSMSSECVDGLYFVKP